MSFSQKLPSNPSLRQLRNQAKDLHKALKAGYPSALGRIGGIQSAILLHV